MVKKFNYILTLALFFTLIGCDFSSVRISFESNGGTPVEQVTEFDPSFYQFETPTKEGFIFAGWYEDTELTEPFDPDKERSNWKLTLYAKWVPNSVPITVIHYTEVLIDGTYTVHSTRQDTLFINLEAMDLSPLILKIPGYAFNGSKTKFTENHVSTYRLSIYYDLIVYTLVIDENGGDPVEDISVKYGQAITPPLMTKEGYTFSGWDKPFPETMPLNGDTLVAQWTVNSSEPV